MGMRGQTPVAQVVLKVATYSKGPKLVVHSIKVPDQQAQTSVGRDPFLRSSSSNFHRSSLLLGTLSPGGAEGGAGCGGAVDGIRGPDVATAGTLASAGAAAASRWARSKAPNGRDAGAVPTAWLF